LAGPAKKKGQEELPAEKASKYEIPESSKCHLVLLHLIL